VRKLENERGNLASALAELLVEWEWVESQIEEISQA
jgi:hypothetical protein